MNHTEAQIYLPKVAETWEKADLTLLEKYYSKDLQANMFGTDITYQDLVGRLQYLQLHQKQRKLDILEIICDNNKIAARLHYSAIDDQEGVVELDMIGIYHLNDEQKITRAWACAAQPVNYTLLT